MNNMSALWSAMLCVILIFIVFGIIASMGIFTQRVWQHINQDNFRTTFEITTPGIYAIKWDGKEFICQNVDKYGNILKRG